jgi:hypothetical protein
MSQEAEYFLRNISRNEVRQLASRISQNDRAASERRVQDWWRQQASNLEGRLRGELAGLRQEVEGRQQRLQEQINCNRRLTEALQRQSDLHGDVLLEQRRALDVLAAHDQQLELQIQETRNLQAALTKRLSETESKLIEEVSQRKKERQQQSSNLEVQRRLTLDSINQLDHQLLESVGMQAEMSAVRMSLERAMRVGSTKAEEQAAFALFVEIQNRTDNILLECSRRDSELGRLREIVRLNLEANCQRVAEFREDPEANQVFAHNLAAISQQLDQQATRIDKLSKKPVGDFSSKLAIWEQETSSILAISQQIEQLWRERDQVLDQIRTRNRIMEAVVEALIEVWGAQFEIDILYAVTDDPRSTLMLQTKRPFGRNATVHFELSGRMQMSFTGYLGMECAKDVASFRKQLEQAGDLKIDELALHDQADRPNPPGVDGSGIGGPMIYREPTRRKKEDRENPQ